MLTTDTSVFISYSHDSPEHGARVLALADRLRAEGVDAVLDQYQTAPPEGWQLWMEKQIRDAKFVLLVCTETYRRRVMKEERAGRGLGVVWESSIIYQHLYNVGGVNEKFIPVVFGPSGTPHIPLPLQPTTYYDVSLEEGYENLYRRLTEQPGTPALPLGEPSVLPPRPRPALPQPLPQPTPNLAHPYALQANFTGRVSERRELTAWLADDALPVCALIAMGGMGKSALSWYWITKDVLRPAQSSVSPIGRVMWWSFYEGESSFARFVDDALKYVSGQPVDAASFPTTYDRAQELRRQLQSRRTLFVLDGFERQLRAYASLDAAYQRDEVTFPSREARACVEPEAARLLQHIVSGTTRAKVLLTTRLMVSDLEDRAGDALAGVLKRELKELPRDDAVAFMQAQGVTKGAPAEIADVCAAYGNHPLSLRLLSGLIARDARTPGDIDAAPRHDVHDDLVQRHRHVLEQSYNALPKRERALLSRIAAFRNPMPYEALLIFNTLGREERFQAALEDLRERGLLQRDTASNRYALHPIVRHYAYGRLTDKKGIHTRLRDYFSKVPVPGDDELQSVEDLAPVIELYHHNVRAGRYDEAFEVLYTRLVPYPLHFRFGASQLMIELKRALFPDGEAHPPRLKEEIHQAWTLNALASSYALSGQLRRAMLLYESTNDFVERQGDKSNLAIGLGAAAKAAYIPLGELKAAERNLRYQMELLGEINDEFWEAVCHQSFGRLLVYLGEFEKAARELEVSTLYWERIGDKQGSCLDQSIRAIRALLTNDAVTALAAAREARQLASVERVERDIICAEWLLGASQIMGGEIDTAASHLTEALTRCRRINLPEFEPHILLAWGRWHRTRGGVREAKSFAEEAASIANRFEYRLAQAEIHNFLAQLAFDAGEREAGRYHAQRARERAWCDGPPHCYKPALDEAEGVLKELAANE